MKQEYKLKANGATRYLPYFNFFFLPGCVSSSGLLGIAAKDLCRAMLHLLFTNRSAKWLNCSSPDPGRIKSASELHPERYAINYGQQQNDYFHCYFELRSFSF